MIGSTLFIPHKYLTTSRWYKKEWSLIIWTKSNRFHILPPYINALIKEKRKAARTAIKTQTTESRTKYNQLQAKVKLEITKYKQAKWQSFCSNLNNLSTSDSMLWKAINSIDSSKKKNSLPTTLRMGDGQLTRDPQIVSNMMADFLQDTFTEPEDEDFDQTHKQLVDSSMENIFKSNPRTIKLVTQEELIWIITNKIRTKGAPGSDGIKTQSHKKPSTNLHAATTKHL